MHPMCLGEASGCAGRELFGVSRPTILTAGLKCLTIPPTSAKRLSCARQYSVPPQGHGWLGDNQKFRTCGNLTMSKWGCIMWETNLKDSLWSLREKCQALGLNPFTVFGADVSYILDVLHLNGLRVVDYHYSDTRYFAFYENEGKWHLAWFDMKGQSERECAQALIAEREIAPMTASDDTPRDAVLMAMRGFEDTSENASVRSWLYRLSVKYYEFDGSVHHVGSAMLPIDVIVERLLAAGVSRKTIVTHFARDIYDAPDLFMMLGREVLEARSFGEYQGIWVIVYRYEGLYHLTVYDYGTCSGCDEIMRLCSDNDVQGLIELVERSIGYTGNTLADAVNAMERDGWASSWYIDPYRTDIIAWLQTMKA